MFPATVPTDQPTKERRRELRTATVCLILLNLALATVHASRSTNTAGLRSCCRGEGPEAYCCYECCLWGTFCDTDQDCSPS